MTNNGRLVRLPSGTLTGGPPSCGRGTPPDTCPLAAPGKQPRRGGSGTLRYSDSTPGALQGPPGGGGGALASASAAADALFAAAVAATTRQHAATAGSLAAQVPQAAALKAPLGPGASWAGAQPSCGGDPAAASSQGSLLHDGSERCSPCAWHYKPQGCQLAAACPYCHACPQGELKRRKKAKVAALRQGQPQP
ncbi:unnamed protein product [Prorocentrum cordatum]|uniref:C3H1-type domain-containing protein n=1 Tax=Prorocentrum cordatum TaxID=2364126 RepID=A0ABN9V2B7_9DINO|nr:unnamed protein product [Polarella glacialis]